jgi:ankyrin repeat protein
MKSALVTAILPAILLLSRLSAGHAAVGSLGTPSLNDQLLIAAGKGDIASVRQLLETGAQVDARGDRGSTPLLIAVRAGQVETARLLLDHGAK